MALAWRGRRSRAGKRSNGRGTILVVGARGMPDVEGGAEKGAEATFPLVVSAGYRVIVLGLSRHIKGDSFRGVELRKAPEVRILKTDKLFYYLYAILVAWRLKPDVVHLQGLGAALFLWVYKLLGFRTVVRYGSADYILPKWGFIGRLGFKASELQLRLADAVIAVGPALRERLRSVGVVRNVHVMPNAVDEVVEIDKATPDCSAHADLLNSPFILSVGRVTSQKNVHNLIKGFQLLQKRRDLAYKLVIIGGLDEADYVASLTPLLSENVVLLGRLPRSALGPFYARCAAYVNASVHEGSSNAVLEAISWHAPLVLSDIAENKDFGLEPRHYFAADDPASIAAAIGAALDEPSAFAVDAGHYTTWPTVAERTTSIYQAISGA